uniref:Uncharacterized protein n=1 Tax=Tanacetum cinerariifolium TaxID=118510 RepID=A0A6L2N5J7_TANCI|nr:hypothetical protein [Tanacetum cinerariifolium]
MLDLVVAADGSEEYKIVTAAMAATSRKSHTRKSNNNVRAVWTHVFRALNVFFTAFMYCFNDNYKAAMVNSRQRSNGEKNPPLLL